MSADLQSVALPRKGVKGVLNFEQIGKIIAVIKDSSSETKKSKKVKAKHSTPNEELYVCDNKQAKEVRHPEEIVVLDDDHHFQLAINQDTERQIGYVVGASGSGKSYFVKQFAMEYHRVYPSRPIFIISALSEDSTLDSLKCLQRIKLSESFIEEDFKAVDFENSLMILDDTDTITNKKILQKVNQIRDDILQCGRHNNVSCLITSHTACNGIQTRLCLNESHFITFFPSGLGGRALKYLLENYLGFDKQQIKRVKSIDSRAITIIKGFPQVILAERECYLLD